tara:strand:+ start:1193 stop:1426 length:234 start_codon:yes stop_codon:yes gene_type:complete
MKIPCVLKILFSFDLKSLGFDINIKKDTIPAIMKEINILSSMLMFFSSKQIFFIINISEALTKHTINASITQFICIS